VLDAFAGSGAMGFEAISRGAKSALLIELDKNAFRTIKENIESLDLDEEVSTIQGNAKGWSNNNVDKQFDIVICDPPYDAVLEQLIHKIARHVAPGGLLVLSWPTKEPTPEMPGMKLLRHKTYGNATVFIYSRG
jgi:16S rRNA (guanine966-N2)-methyltransferase